MTKIKYLEKKKWREDTQSKFEIIKKTIEEYDNQGYRLTLRQLYYQLVSRDKISNQKREYSKLSKLLTEARMYGMVDWDIIEDRVRVPKFPSQFDNIRDLVNAALHSYRLNRWKNQKNYVEVWIEKDA